MVSLVPFSDGLYRSMNSIPQKIKSKSLYFPLIISIGLTLAGLMLLTYLVLLSNVFGSFSIGSFVRGDVGRSHLRVALLKSSATFRHFKRLNGNYGQTYATWEDFLEGSPLSYTTITSGDLEKGLIGIDVIILPGVAVLSERERNRLEEFVEQGGGVILSWATGLYSPSGEWNGWGFVERLTGSKIVSLGPGGENRSFVAVLSGDSPLNLALPAGLRLRVHGYDEVFTAEKAEVDAVWVSEKTFYGSGGIVRDSYGDGRAVWFGITANMIEGRSEEQDIFKKILLNAIDWVGQRPKVYAPSWPDRTKMAFSLTVDVEAGMEKLSDFLPLVQQRGLPVTFFIVTEEAAKHPFLFSGMTVGEMAIHADAHIPFENQPLMEQMERLKVARLSVERISGQQVFGFRPVEERYDRNTIEAMGKVGLDYMVTSPTKLTGPKEVFTEKGEKIYLLPRSHYDDYYMFYQTKLDSTKALQLLQEDFDLTLFTGGHYILPIHTTPPWGFLASREKRNTLIEFLDRIDRKRGVWKATLQDVLKFWQKKENVKVTSIKRTKNRISLSISNPTERTIDDYTLFLYLPESANKVTVSSEGRYRFFFDRTMPFLHIESVSTELPHKSVMAGKLRMKFRDIKPHETRTFFIDMAGAEGSL